MSCVSVCVHMCACRGHKRISDTLGQQLQVVVCPTIWVLGTYNMGSPALLQEQKVPLIPELCL